MKNTGEQKSVLIFFIAAIINEHRFSDLNDTTVETYNFVGLISDMNLTRL